MRVSSGTVLVGITPLQIDGNSVQPCVLKIHNNESTKTLHAGNSNVTIANGYPIDKLSSIEVKLPPGESIFMVSESGSHSVSWLRITE
jgi:hypothetical protein